MEKTIDRFDESQEFSLVQGGPLFQLLLRAGLVRPGMDLLARRIVVISAVAWLPLLLLTVLSGDAIGGSAIPFLYDIAAHGRLLLCVPLLLCAEVIVHQRIKTIVRQFVDLGRVATEDQPRFASLIASALRLRNSVLAECLLLVCATVGGYLLGPRYLAFRMATWFAVPIGGHSQLTLAGYWYFFVSLMIFRFLLFRWYFRLFVWYRFLWQVSRQIPLRLNALHPDGAGGLAFLQFSVFALLPLILAHTIGLAVILGGKILHEGATLPEFKFELLAWMIFLMMLALTPLAFFIFQLANAKRMGLREYNSVASQYVDDFRRKWMEGRTGEGEALIGTADIQSLADLSNSFEVVREMRIVPFGRSTIVQLAVFTALPLAPLALTMFPLDQLIDRALAVLF